MMLRVYTPLLLLLLFFATLILLSAGYGYDAVAIQLEEILNAPSHSHLLGTDELGRDVLTRLKDGAMLSLFVGLCVLALTGSIGITIGVVSGYCGGWVDNLLMRITDVFLSFPGILIAIAFAALAGPGVSNVIWALGLMGWIGFARLARVQTLKIRHEDHISAAQMAGVGSTRILGLYVLPNIAAPLLVEAAFCVAGAMLAEAGLSFLGIGIQPPEASLGTMLREGARYMLVAPHLVIFPGGVLMFLVFVLNWGGDRLRDHLDVRYSR